MEFKKIIVIPSYQPNDRLIQLVSDINKEFKKNIEIIVVDDGSGKKYLSIFDSIMRFCTVLHHSVNKGKGRALKTAYEYIMKHYLDEKYIIVTVDCDGQHSLDDVIKLFEYNISHPNTLVLGSRKLDKDVPLRSKVGNTITRNVFSLATHTFVYDTQTGLRSFSNELIQFMINTEGERFEYEMNVLLFSSRNSIPIHEIEIQTIYIDNNSGSHFHAIRDSYRIYKQIIQFSWLSLASFAIDFLLFFLFIQCFNFTLLFSYAISKIISFLFFIFNKHSRKKLTVYSYFSFFLLLTLGLLIIYGLQNYAISIIIAKVIVEIILMFFNHILFKLFFDN